MPNLKDLTNRTILYIDDQSEDLIKVLSLFEKEYNYKILTENSVKDGLAKLDGFFGVIDAVILDLKFPGDKLQGKDALKSIKEKYPWLPVFILTGVGNPEDEREAKLCLENGATNFYHKSNFDIETLLLHIDKALDFSQKEIQLKHLEDYQNKLSSAPVLDISFNGKEYEGIFAYKLTQVIKLKDKTRYFNWTQEVLKTLVLGFDNLILEQIYREENNKVGIYFIFKITEKNRDAIFNTFKKVFFNFSSLFNTNPELHPYQFKSILQHADLEKLKEKITRTSKKQYIFNRNTQDYRTKKNIGFGTKQKSTPIKVKIPLLITNHQKNIDFQKEIESYQNKMDFLIHILSGIKGISIHHQIRKIKLSVDEIDMLQQAKQDFLNNEADAFVSTQQILKHQKELLSVQTFCNTPKEDIATLLSAISDVFYDGNATAKKITKQDNNIARIDAIQYVSYPEETAKILKFPVRKMSSVSDILISKSNEAFLPVQATSQSGILIGEKNGEKVYIDKKQFQKHTYIIGKTGTGKTSILYTMLMDRIHNGNGVALIDPHGDIFELLSKNIPASRKKDVIILDPTDATNNFGFNALDYDPNFPEQQSFIVYELIKIFDEIYNLQKVGGPMFEMYFKNILFLIMETIPNATLNDMAKIFTDWRFRKSCLLKSQNQNVKDFFNYALETTGEQDFSNFAPYVLSKITRFTENHFIAPVVCDPNKSFDFRKMIDDKKIFLVRLNKGRIGDEAVSFLGRILFNRIIMATYSRSNIPESKREDFSLFVDEFQNFTSNDIISALGESRKYHLQLILANQTFAQLKERVAENILSNVGSIISASVSPNDATKIVPFLEPVFTKEDLVQLDNYKFVINTLYNNRHVKPFVFNSIPY